MKELFRKLFVYIPHNTWVRVKKLLGIKNKKVVRNFTTDSYYHYPKNTIVNVKCTYTPERKSAGAACADLVAKLNGLNTQIIKPGETILIPTGLSIAIPHGKVGLLFIRSGLSIKTALTLANGVGVIDSDYRGEILVPIRNTHPSKRYTINNGDRIAQLMIVDFFTPSFVHTKTLSETARNTGGFGSTGV